MTPVKLNVYISHAPEDKKTVEELYAFLRPMRDEVNIWYNDPPKGPAPLPLPWEWISTFLPIFQPYDYRQDYAGVNQRRKERAHIYLFLTSYKSLNNGQIENDIRAVAERRVEGDPLSPQVYPVIVAPSLWKEKSALSGYKTLGPKKTLYEIKPAEEGYYEIANQLAKVVKQMQRDLDEAKFHHTRLVAADNTSSSAPVRAQPYLGGDDESLEFRVPPRVNPPEWLGWFILIFLFLSVMRGIQGKSPTPTFSQYEKAEPENRFQPEYPREYPMRPPADNKPLPQPE